MQRIDRHVEGFYMGLRIVVSLTEIIFVHSSTQFSRLFILNKICQKMMHLLEVWKLQKYDSFLVLNIPTFGVNGFKPITARLLQSIRNRVRNLCGSVEWENIFKFSTSNIGKCQIQPVNING